MSVISEPVLSVEGFRSHISSVSQPTGTVIALLVAD